MKAVLPLSKAVLSLMAVQSNPKVWESKIRDINSVRLLDQLLLVDSKAKKPWPIPDSI